MRFPSMCIFVVFIVFYAHFLCNQLSHAYGRNTHKEWTQRTSNLILPYRMHFYDFFLTIEFRWFRLFFFCFERASYDMIKIFRFNSNKSGLFVSFVAFVSEIIIVDRLRHIVYNQPKDKPKAHNFPRKSVAQPFYSDFFIIIMMACHKIYDWYNVFVCDCFTYFI